VIKVSDPKFKKDASLEVKLAQTIGDCPLGKPVHAFASVSSTMDMAHALAAEGAPEGTLIWAARQEKGRGRLGRTWVSPEGGVYLSLILRPKRPTTEISQLSLVAGLSVAQAVQAVTSLMPSIRWPNDLLVNDRKLCGILVEAEQGSVLIGIGINVSTPIAALPPEATSILAAGLPCDAYLLTGEICRRLQKWYAAWTSKGFAPVRVALRPWIGGFGGPVRITAGATEMEGIATDLDDSGRLLVRLDSGIVRSFGMGEVTLLR